MQIKGRAWAGHNGEVYIGARAREEVEEREVGEVRGRSSCWFCIMPTWLVWE